ncbi:hypothetical protein GWI33_002316 [Rhynchophorus ferrugineus]|uniref:Uncharacterized protein n=1 Tax=Rhynchophorus ferrugineus TaxID=354439 RepID=A0A834IR74_RHYFE|nr:hypothetical protein GWI33_002316 [Rhynchophorus ferrugineus]
MLISEKICKMDPLQVVRINTSTLENPIKGYIDIVCTILRLFQANYSLLRVGEEPLLQKFYTKPGNGNMPRMEICQWFHSTERLRSYQ